MKKIIIITISIIIFSNFFSGLINLAVLGVGHVFTYETYDGKYKFNYNPHKGGSLDRLNLCFEQLQEEEPIYVNTNLSRTFKQKPLHFWNWYSYYFSNEYRFPYKESSGTSICYQGLHDK